MKTLQERLDRIHTDFDESVPPEVTATMTRATDELRASGILSRIPRAGSALIPFELSDTKGEPLRSAELLQRGPLVLGFYRGLW